MYAYIHGLNSDGNRSIRNLSETLGKKVFNLFWECDRPFDENIAYLLSQCEKIEAANPIDIPLFESPIWERFVIIGSSMGAYYASVLASINKYPCVLFNPVVYPQKTLKKFKGLNTNFATGNTYEMTQELIDSYNFSGNLTDSQIERAVVLGRNDEVLDYREAEEFYSGTAQIKITDDSHQIKDYGPFKEVIAGLEFRPVILNED